MLKPCRSRVTSILNACALAVALVTCLIVIVFSWPDRHDRNRATGPNLARCCEIRIGSMVLVSRPAKVASKPVGPAGPPAVIAIVDHDSDPPTGAVQPWIRPSTE
jgi:hypothetical protein